MVARPEGSRGRGGEGRGEGDEEEAVALAGPAEGAGCGVFLLLLLLLGGVVGWGLGWDWRRQEGAQVDAGGPLALFLLRRWRRPGSILLLLLLIRHPVLPVA